MEPEDGSLELLEVKLDYRFHDKTLLQQALTHKSYCYENPNDCRHYESLEFLGDAVLGFVISSAAYRASPQSTEGQLSKVKAHLVSARQLYPFAHALDLGRFLRLSHGEEKTGGRSKRALLVDAFEAVIAAIYLDGGLEAARTFILRHYGDAFGYLTEGTFTSPDFKSTLQEKLHRLGRGGPVYRVVEETGPDHRKHFLVEVMCGRDVLARGEGETKKQAQQSAAFAALSRLDAESRPTAR